MNETTPRCQNIFQGEPPQTRSRTNSTDIVILEMVIRVEDLANRMSQPSSGAVEGKDTALDEAVPSEDELEDLRLILDQTRTVLLQQILAHDSGVLCRAELEARNPDIKTSTLQYHIDTLVENGIIAKLDAPENKRDLPSVFYAVSEHGIGLLKRADLYDEIAIWNQVYSEVPVPDDLQKIEEMDRPEPDWYDTGN